MIDPDEQADLDPAECLKVLGLHEAASAAEIKRAYRRLAQRFHPDKVGEGEASRRHFVAISKAYRSLMRVARLTERGRAVGRCCVCRQFGEVTVGLDGMARCPVCALRPGGRPLLPMPVFTVVKCVSAVLLLVLTVYFLVRALQTGRFEFAAIGFLSGLGALLALAITSLRVIYCIRPREEYHQRSARS